MNNEYFKLDTELGSVSLHPQGCQDKNGHTIYVDLSRGGHALLSSEPHIAIRGVPHTGSCHLYQWHTDGKFHIGPLYETWDGNRKITDESKFKPIDEWSRSKSLYLYSIRHGNSLDQKNATDAAKAKFKEIIEEAVTKWALSHQYILDGAEVDRLKYEIEKLNEKIEEASLALAALNKEYFDTKKRLAEHVKACGMEKNA